ncbi:hypothetical protein [Uliginosibacterium gangwonense]|uniref:hypothetical protein n=1 Tax=Uliginosibacterium gangwonense TaxID=392736 RepID=UPI0012F7A7A4|nr:hypothetical protein [Uliginosibacterium gangwonense]
MNEKQTPPSQPGNPELVARNKLLLIATWIMLAVSFSIASLANTLTAQFESVFASFGAELPALTLIFLKGRLLWWIFPAIALYIAIFVTRSPLYTRRTQNNITWGLAALFVTVVITITVSFFAMYQPIFNLGTVG